MEKDGAKEAVRSHAESVKASVRLDAESQSPKYSGHESAPYSSGGHNSDGSYHAPGK